MNLHNFTPAQVQDTITRLHTDYMGNVYFRQTHSRLSKRGWRIRGVLRVHSSHGVGARRAPSGRYGPYASWEAHRDFMVQLFRLNPDGRISTWMETYEGLNDFLLKHAATAHRLVYSAGASDTIRNLTVKSS